MQLSLVKQQLHRPPSLLGVLPRNDDASLYNLADLLSGTRDDRVQGRDCVAVVWPERGVTGRPFLPSRGQKRVAELYCDHEGVAFMTLPRGDLVCSGTCSSASILYEDAHDDRLKPEMLFPVVVKKHKGSSIIASGVLESKTP